MDALETLIRDTLREHAADAPTVVSPVREPSSRRWLYAGLAAVLVVGLAAVVTVTRREHTSTTAPATFPVPAGYKPISYHGITLAVPSNLPVVTGGCPTTDTHLVLAFDPTVLASCPNYRGTPGLPDVTLLPTDHLLPGVTLRNVDGRRLVLRNPGVVVAVNGLPRGVARTVLHSVRVTPVDYLGCQDRDPVISPASGDRMVPGSPTSAAVCRYTQFADSHQVTWLTQSRAITPLTEIVTTINDLDSRSLRNVSLASLPSDLIIFSYPDGSTYRLRVGDADTTLFLVVNRDRYASVSIYSTARKLLENIVR